jgi:prepilin peptidase CpaA
LTAEIESTLARYLPSSVCFLRLLLKDHNLMFQNLDIVVAIFVLAFTATAMYFDLKVRKIPNGLTVSTFAAALVFYVASQGIPGLGFALGGFAAGFLPLLVLWLIGGGGGGDVKLMGALGAWLGAPVTLIVFFGSAIVALVMMISLIVWRSLARTSPIGATGAEAVVTKFDSAQRLVPYAVPVTVMAWGWMLMQLAVGLLN